MAAQKNAGGSSERRRAKGPTEVAPGLFVGGWGEAEGFSGARFCVLDEKPAELPNGTHIPVYDERTGGAIRPNLDRLAKEAAAAKGRGEAVVVFCGHGIRRGPLGAAWILHRNDHLTLEQAFDRIQAVRPRIERPAAWMDDPTSVDDR